MSHHLGFALAALSLVGPQDGPSLLPDAPAGWGFERLDFPLDFAPDIALSGFEELRFAPGMFDPESETYFSYVLAVRAEGRVELDGAALEEFLVRYYRGLMVSVAGSRGLETDGVDAQAHVARGAHGFVATVETIDAFTTGAPLRLSLELSVHHTEDATELFGLASPMPADGAAWRALRGFGRAWRAARAPEAYFNHLFLVTDEATWSALEEDAWLRDTLGVSELRTTERADRTYTGRYLYGQHTYFELLRDDPAAGFASGETGIAFGFEAEGGTEAMAARLEQAGVRSFAGERSRALGEEQVPWFKILGFEQPTATTRLSLFSLEYLPEFLARWHPAGATPAQGIGRAAVLARYAAQLEQQERRRAAPLGDVVEVRLELGAPERARFLEVCRAFGYQVSEQEARTLAQGPGIEFVVKPSEVPGGVVGFTCSLREPVEPRSWRVGGLALERGAHSLRVDRVR